MKQQKLHNHKIINSRMIYAAEWTGSKGEYQLHFHAHYHRPANMGNTEVIAKISTGSAEIFEALLNRRH